jgi:hypothetical protein
MPRVNPTSPLNFLTTAGQAQQQSQFDATYEFNAAQFDFQQNLIQRNARQKQADLVANIQNANATGRYEAVARENAQFKSDMMQLSSSLAGGFSGGGGAAGGLSQKTQNQEMFNAAAYRSSTGKGLSAADMADMNYSMSTYGR